MDLFYQLKRNAIIKKFEKQYDKCIANGKFKKFDDAFYQQFEGMYYEARPIYYYLREKNEGRCFETSAILALAMNQKDIHICRGILKTQGLIHNMTFEHGWIEVGDIVYDTSWSIIADKESYYKVMGVVCKEDTTKEEYFAHPLRKKESIHSKEYYEKSDNFLYHMLVEGDRQKVELELQNLREDDPSIPYKKKFLEDLPKIPYNPLSAINELLADNTNRERLSASYNSVSN